MSGFICFCVRNAQSEKVKRPKLNIVYHISDTLMISSQISLMHAIISIKNKPIDSEEVYNQIHGFILWLELFIQANKGWKKSINHM